MRTRCGVEGRAPRHVAQTFLSAGSDGFPTACLKISRSLRRSGRMPKFFEHGPEIFRV
jgi:hypothetical protein